MKRMIAWFATNHVAANLVMGFSVLAGLAAMTRIPVQIYPDVDFPFIVITVPYLGAAPEEVASGVCDRIEERVEGISGIKEMVTIADEGVCVVNLTLFLEVDATAVLNEVESTVNAIDTFPQETEKPVILLPDYSSIVMEIAVTGAEDERALKEIGRRVRDDIKSLPGITQVALANSRPYEISVEIAEPSLLRNNLTFDQVAAALRQSSADLPGGAVKTDAGEVLLRTRGQAYWGEELERLVVTAASDGTRVLLRDVAEVVDGFEDTSQGLTFNGKTAALVQVSKVGDQNIQEVSETVRRYLAEAPSRYPNGVELTLWKDESVMLTDRLGALIDSGLQGLLMVLVVLALFLRPHLALWVGAGIPIAFLGGVFLIYWFGYAIDAVSVVGFIVALGLLVDDAVVVGEAVYVSQQGDRGQLAGAIEGAQQVLVPVTFGVLTTIAAFVPLLLAAGLIGQLMSVTAATVICCLVFSLVECQAVLPAHLGHRSARMPLGEFGLTFLLVVVIAAFAMAPDARTGVGLAVAAVTAVWVAHRMGGLSRLGVAFASLQTRFESGLAGFIDMPLRRAVEAALRARQTTLALAVVALISAGAIVSSGHLPFSPSMDVETDRVVASLTLPLGVSEEETARVVSRLTAAARQVQEELALEFGDDPPIRHILVASGSQPSFNENFSGTIKPRGSHLAEVSLQLSPSETRDTSTQAIAERWRAAAGAIADGELRFSTALAGGDSNVEIRVFGEDLAALREFAAAVRGELSSYPGVREAFDSYREGKQELKLSITPAGEALGLTLVDLGRQVRQAFYGEEVQRVQRGPEDIRIMLRYPAERRRSLAALDSLRVRTPSGDAVPFSTVAMVEAGRGYSAIERVDGKRSILVSGEVDPAFTTSAAVQAALLQSGFLDEAAARVPGVSYKAEGLAMQQETTDSLMPLFMLSMFAIFALLAIPLRSYTQPLVIMSVLPFAFVGAVWGHVIMLPLDAITSMSMSSVFGVVAAAGVVVNATLVLMHAVNRLRGDGDSLEEALAKACCLRARPILITTVTTFAGVMPLILSKNAQAAAMIPMAVSLAYGVLFSVLAALFVVPALWLVLDDLRGGAGRVTGAIGDLLGSAPRLTQWMARYPYVQEGMRSKEFTDLQIDEELGLDAETAAVARRGLVRVYYEREFDHVEMRAQLAAMAAKTPTVDDFTQEARVWAEQRTFQVGVHMLNGTISPLDAARPITDILDATLAALFVAGKAEFAVNNGGMPGSRVALLASGSFGRREFATGTPLKLLFLYDHRRVPGEAATDPAAWHAQLLQRVMRAVRDLSPEGTLFESATAYARGGSNGSVTAWTLAQLAEHLDAGGSAEAWRMLVDARVIEAEDGLGEDFAALREAALADGGVGAAPFTQTPRQFDAVPVDPWDVRQRAGGLEDVELAAEALKLAAGGRVPAMLAASLGSTFRAAAQEGLLADEAAARMTEAATLWQNIEGFLRMACVGTFDPTAASLEQRQALAEIGGVEDFDALPDAMASTADRTAALVRRLLGETPDNAHAG
ncbi:MAG: hypothetical protein F4Y26_13995 [Gammaproteobacteria bacterium]|nr:hypothetical protein [Gammaproteobacteria bacterium]